MVRVYDKSVPLIMRHLLGQMLIGEASISELKNLMSAIPEADRTAGVIMLDWHIFDVNCGEIDGREWAEILESLIEERYDDARVRPMVRDYIKQRELAG